MNDTPLSQENVDRIFSRLDAEDVDHFYRGYQRWRFQQRIAALREQIDALQQRIAANHEEMQQYAPSPMALASLARMQSRGVQDTNLLDRLLDRGEEWLDRTIQRLEYCEQTGLIGDDYTKWCEHALEGAYDWIDSLTGANGAAPPQELDILPDADREFAALESLPQITEAMLLQKLMSEEDEATLKIPAVPPTPVLPRTNAIELSDAPVEQIVAEEPGVLDSSKLETPVQDEIIPQTGDAQPLSEKEVTPPTENTLELTETAPESEPTGTSNEDSVSDNAAQAIITDESSKPDGAIQATISDKSNEPGDAEQAIISNESNEPGDTTQTTVSDESSEPNNPAQVDNSAQEPAPSKQYDFPESFDEIIPAEAQTSLPQDNPTPLAEVAAGPAATNRSSAAQQAAVPAARPPRKHNFWRKLVYVLLGR